MEALVDDAQSIYTAINADARCMLGTYKTRCSIIALSSGDGAGFKKSHQMVQVWPLSQHFDLQSYDEYMKVYIANG